MCAEFARVCEQSTDFHFPELERQFQDIEDGVLQANEWRMQQRHHQGAVSMSSTEDGDRISLKSSGSASSGSEVCLFKLACLRVMLNI